MKKILMAGLCLFVSSVLFAQVEVGIGGHLAKFSQNNGGQNFIGPGLTVGYAPYESRVSFYGGFNYYLPKKESYTTTAYRSDNGSPSTIEVPTDEKLKLYMARLGGKYLFVGDNSTDFGFYGAAEAALGLVSGSYDYADYDANYYISTESKQSYSQLMIGLHLGVQKMAGSGFAFLEAGFRMPATEYNSRYGYATDVYVPAHLAASIGYRVILGGE